MSSAKLSSSVLAASSSPNKQARTEDQHEDEDQADPMDDESGEAAEDEGNNPDEEEEGEDKEREGEESSEEEPEQQEADPVDDEATARARRDHALALADYWRGPSYALAVRGLVREVLSGSRGSTICLPNAVVDIITAMSAPLSLREIAEPQRSAFLLDRGPFFIRKRMQTTRSGAGAAASSVSAATVTVEDYARSAPELHQRLRAHGLRRSPPAVPGGPEALAKMLKHNGHKVRNPYWQRRIVDDAADRANIIENFGQQVDGYEAKRWDYLWESGCISGDDFDEEAAQAQMELEQQREAPPTKDLDSALKLVAELGPAAGITVHELRPCFSHCAIKDQPRTLCNICADAAATVEA